MCKYLILATVRRVGALLLGGVIFWLVIEHCDTRRGRAIVHVSTPQVEVMVDNTIYWVESIWDTPLVCELKPGRHVVQMRRDGRLLYEEPFMLASGQEIVLVAWDGYRDGRCPEVGRPVD